MSGQTVSFALFYCDKHLIVRELISVKLPVESQDIAIYQV